MGNYKSYHHDDGMGIYCAQINVTKSAAIAAIFLIFFFKLLLQTRFCTWLDFIKAFDIFFYGMAIIYAHILPFFIFVAFDKVDRKARFSTGEAFLRWRKYSFSIKLALLCSYFIQVVTNDFSYFAS